MPSKFSLRLGRRGALSAKRGNANYYKGTGARTEGNHTTKGACTHAHAGAAHATRVSGPRSPVSAVCAAAVDASGPRASSPGSTPCRVSCARTPLPALALTVCRGVRHPARAHHDHRGARPDRLRGACTRARASKTCRAVPHWPRAQRWLAHLLPVPHAPRPRARRPTSRLPLIARHLTSPVCLQLRPYVAGKAIPQGQRVPDWSKLADGSGSGGELR